MTSTQWFFENGGASHTAIGETVKEHRERIALEERKRAERRLLELAEQRSDTSSPDMRIRSWEKMHGLRLPTDANHPILDVIAVATRLTLEQVQEEQRVRAARRSAPAQPA